jgi:glycosyltransferase involved in cell wall biosynthesis
VRFAGWQAKPGPFIAAANSVAMSSSHETLGNVILEAWSVGKPVVSTRSRGPVWLMTDGEDGLMADIGDSAAFAAAIDRLRRSPDLRTKLVNNGRETLKRNVSVDGVTDAYLRLFADHVPAQSWS